MNEDRLRIGDAEREAAATALGDHFAQGRLSADEHAERLDRIWSARTRGDLAPVFGDLPGRFGASDPVDAPVSRPPASWVAGRWVRPGLPGPVVVVLAVLLSLTILTHLPLILAGVVVLCVLAARRRGNPSRGQWSRWAR